MKIKPELADDIVVSKIWNIQKVAPFFGVDKNGYSKSDWIMAYLLTALASFDEELSLARKSLGIKEIYNYSSIKSFDTLNKIFNSLGQDKALTSVKIAKKIIKKYSLGDNWQKSVLTAFFTDTLPVPDGNLIQIKTKSNCCLIKINKKISINELKRCIRENSTLIKNSLDGLPKINKSKIKENTILWGHFAWILKKGGMNSWTEMSNFIGKKIYNDGSAYGMECAPSSTEIERYYKRFIASLKKIGK